MKDIKVTDSVKYIGVDDHDIDLFESQYHHIALGEGRQQAVEEGDQQGGQGQIQDGRHTDSVETAFEREVRPQGLPAQMDGRLGGAVDHEVDDESGIYVF